MGIVDVGAIEEHAREVELDSGWKRLKGRYYGGDSGCPLKLEVSVGGGKWDTEVQQANIRIADGLSPRERQKYQWTSSNLATQENEKLSTAYRVAIDRTECLRTVCWAGPVFENRADFDDWVEGKAKVVLQGKDVEPPSNAIEIFKSTKEGQLLLPTQTPPPPEWILSKDEIFRLKSRWLFLQEVAIFRNQMESAKMTAEDDDLGNLQESGDTPPPGKRSTKTPEQLSKDT
jgi:hypothetical protein